MKPVKDCDELNNIMSNMLDLTFTVCSWSAALTEILDNLEYEAQRDWRCEEPYIGIDNPYHHTRVILQGYADTFLAIRRLQVFNQRNEFALNHSLHEQFKAVHNALSEYINQ